MSESKTNQCDYTLPPLPAHPDAYNGDFWSTRTTRALHSWGQECAEAARAPLLARLARPAHAHLVGDHINGLVDGCILCDSIKERDAMLARIAELEAERDIDIRALLNVCRVYMASDEMPPEVQAKQALAAAERIRAQIRARRMKESGDA